MTETTGILGRVAEQERQRRAQQYADTYGNPGTTNPNDPGNATGAWYTYTEDDLNFTPVGGPGDPLSGGGGGGGGSAGSWVGDAAGWVKDNWETLKDIFGTGISAYNAYAGAKRSGEGDALLRRAAERNEIRPNVNLDADFADPHNPYARAISRPGPTDTTDWRTTQPDWERADPDVQQSSEDAFRDWYAQNPTRPRPTSDPVATPADPYPSTNPDFDKMDDIGREDVRRDEVKNTSEDAFRDWYARNQPDTVPLIPDPRRADPDVQRTSEDAFRDWYARNEPDSTPAVPRPADEMIVLDEPIWANNTAPTGPPPPNSTPMTPLPSLGEINPQSQEELEAMIQMAMNPDAVARNPTRRRFV